MQFSFVEVLIMDLLWHVPLKRLHEIIVYLYNELREGIPRYKRRREREKEGGRERREVEEEEGT